MKVLTAVAIAALASLLPTAASANVLFYKEYCCISDRLPLALDTPSQPFAHGRLEFINFDGVYANLVVTDKSNGQYNSTGIGAVGGDELIYAEGGRILNLLSWHTLDSWNTGMDVRVYAVPEPSTWLMMLAALIVVGARQITRRITVDRGQSGDLG